jgi:uncharacterized protein YoxC
MMSNTNAVQWNVLGPLVGGSIIALLVVVASVFYAAGIVSSSVAGASKSIESLSTDMASIRQQINGLATTTVHLEDDFHAGAQRMDAQDRELSEIKAQLAALKEQVAAERQAPRK